MSKLTTMESINVNERLIQLEGLLAVLWSDLGHSVDSGDGVTSKGLEDYRRIVEVCLQMTTSIVKAN